MAWCPVCKMEYRDGITTCADCGATLVASLDNVKVKLLSAPEEILEEVVKYLAFNGIENCEILPDTDSTNQKDDMVLMLPEESKEEAAKLVRTFMLQKTMEANPEMEEEEAIDAITNEDDGDLETKAPVLTGIYQDSSAKSEDHKSSAYTLLIVGVLGIIALVLVDLGILPIGLSTTSKYMITGVMGALFLVFLVMGFISFKSSKIFAQKAETESNLSREIKSWATSSLTKEVIDGKIEAEHLLESEEVLYFDRTAIIKKEISNKFLNLEEEFLEHLVDEIYQEIYDHNEA